MLTGVQNLCSCCWKPDIENSWMPSGRYGYNWSLFGDKVDSGDGVNIELPIGNTYLI